MSSNTVVATLTADLWRSFDIPAALTESILMLNRRAFTLSCVWSFRRS